MTCNCLRIRLLLGLLLTLNWVGGAWADSSAEVEGILVLRNGNVMAGKLLLMEDYYQVNLPHGQLRVPVTQVEFSCGSLDEAYEHRQRSRTGSTADSHLELARWCLRHEMLIHAARELEVARSIDSHHSQLNLLERRLKQSRRVSVKKTSLAIKKASPIATVVTSRSEPVTKVQAVRELSPRAKSAFVRQIQPMLLHSCATSGCHGSGSMQQMKLNRFAIEGAGNPRAMLGNLEAVLTQADQQTNGESVLLSYAQAAHGRNRDQLSQPLTPRQIQLLRTWLLEAETGENRTVARVKVAERLPIPNQLSEPRQPKIAGAERVDLFDPEIFNRRYGKQSETQDESTKDR